MIERYKAKLFAFYLMCAKLAELQKCRVLYLKALVEDLPM